MGEEFGAETPFLFFCDFEKELAAAVTAGRRNEFAHFKAFSDPEKRAQIPDPSATTTFEASRLDWSSVAQPPHADWLHFYRRLLKLRSEHIVPRLCSTCRIKADYNVHEDRGLSVRWTFADDSKLTLLANLGPDPISGLTSPASQIIYASDEGIANAPEKGTLPAWSVVWSLES